MPLNWRWNLKSLFTPRIALPLSMAAGLVLPSNAAWSTFFYILVLPTVAIRLGQGWRPDWSLRPFSAMLGLCAWSSLTILWDRNISHQGAGHGYWLLSAACTLAFLLCFMMADGDDPRARHKVITVLILTASAAALLSLVLFVWQGDWTARLGGWAALRTPVFGAAVIDVCVMLTIGRIADAGRPRLLYIAALVPMLVYLPLNGSRTALLALFCGLLIMAFGSRKIFGYLLLAALGLTMAGELLLWLRPDLVVLFVSNALARGTDCHLTIWRTAWQLFLAQPLQGYGPSARLPILPHAFCPPYPSPHNLYLSLLVYSGLIGFLLFWACELLLLRHLYRVTSGPGTKLWLAVLAVPLVAGLSDLTQVIKGPSPLWYIIWVPMLLVATLRPAQTTRD